MKPHTQVSQLMDQPPPVKGCRTLKRFLLFPTPHTWHRARDCSTSVPREMGWEHLGKALLNPLPKNCQVLDLIFPPPSPSLSHIFAPFPRPGWLWLPHTTHGLWDRGSDACARGTRSDSAVTPHRVTASNTQLVGALPRTGPGHELCRHTHCPAPCQTIKHH